MIVLMPINVPKGQYCFGRYNPESDNFANCEQLDSTGGHMTCAYGFRPINQDDVGCLKPEQCFKLKEATND